MKKLKFLPLFFTLCLFVSILAAPGAFALNEPEVDAVSAVLLDRQGGQVLWSKNENARVAPADLTKIMTVLLAAESVEAGTVSISSEVTVTDSAVGSLPQEASRQLAVGETLTLESLMYYALLPSADDACNVIAEYLGGTVDNYVKMMNARAEGLGCTSTYFTNTTGLADANHFTTAADYALIALEAAGSSLFMKICNTAVAEVPETNMSAAKMLKNTNALICDESVYGRDYVYDRAEGMKTGSGADGYCLAAAAADSGSGVELLSVMFGCTKQDERFTMFTETAKLFDWAFENYGYQEVLRSTENIASVDIALGSDSDYVNLRPANSISVLLPNDYDPNEFQYDMSVYALQEGRTLTAPVSAGEVLGEVSVLRNGLSYGTVKLVASASVDLSRMQYIKSSISETVHTRNFRLIFWGLVLFLLLYIAWVTIYWVKRTKYRLAVRQNETAKAVEKARAEAAAREPAAPRIEYFAGDAPAAQPAVTEPEPEVQPAEAEAEVQPEAVQLHAITVFPSAAETPDNMTEDPAQSAEPAPEPAAPKQRSTRPPTELPELSILKEKAERDYFEEFFRQK